MTQSQGPYICLIFFSFRKWFKLFPEYLHQCPIVSCSMYLNSRLVKRRTREFQRTHVPTDNQTNIKTHTQKKYDGQTDRQTDKIDKRTNNWGVLSRLRQGGEHKKESTYSNVSNVLYMYSKTSIKRPSVGLNKLVVIVRWCRYWV